MIADKIIMLAVAVLQSWEITGEWKCLQAAYSYVVQLHAKSPHAIYLAF
jgi:hypothetical protein